MPSHALWKFRNPMLRDVRRIIETHENIQNGDPGNKGLGHLTRAGVLLLCSAWELYIEELLMEAAEKLIERSSCPMELPKAVQRSLSNYVKASKHHLKPLALAGDGWKDVYIELVREDTRLLNSPKQAKIDNLFKELIGIDRISQHWSPAGKIIDEFVKLRGDVAHRGSDAGTIYLNTLRYAYHPQIMKTATDTDNAVTTFIQQTYGGNLPWNRKYT